MEKFRSKNSKAKKETEFEEVISATVKLWRKHHLSYQNTKYVVEKARKTLGLKSEKKKVNIVERLSQEEAQKLIQTAYLGEGKYGLLIKTLFFTGTRANEFVNIKAEDIFFEECEVLITHGKGGKKRYVPILPELSQELKTYLGKRKRGYLFESNRNTKYTTRRIQQIVQECARNSDISKHVYPHLLRHSVATILRQRGMDLDLVQKFLGHSKIETTQKYSEAPGEMMKEIYNYALTAHRKSAR